MKFTQYYLECLSQASYLIGDETTGRAVVVDPRRDIDEYVRDAEVAGLTIELVIETHFHADFLSGHLELAAATGAAIAYSDVAHTDFGGRIMVPAFFFGGDGGFDRLRAFGEAAVMPNAS